MARTIKINNAPQKRFVAIKRKKKARELSVGIEGENFANYNPQTKVFELVEELNGQSEELNDEIKTKFLSGK